MKIIELKKYVIHELEWLKYYAIEKSRQELNSESPIYDQLESIGYTKRVVSLPDRCTGARVKRNSNNDDWSITTEESRNHKNNVYTSLEAWLIIYPESFNDIKKYLLREISEL